MKKPITKTIILIVGFLLFTGISTFAQRKSEKLGRGVIAVNQGSGKVYVSWRLLGTDPSGIAFNIYRSSGGAQGIKLNAAPIVATTDFIDAGVNAATTNAYYVTPVISGVEQAPSASYTLTANSAVQQYERIAVQPIDGGYNYDLKFCWVGDLNRDGEYDYVIDRLPSNYPDSAGGKTAKVEAYLRDGSFKWRVDVGPNVVISGGHNDMVTVFDLDGDGRSEVVLKTSEGTVFGDGTAIGDINGDGKIDYRNVNGDIVGNAPQFISVIDGLTGAELARATMPHVEENSPTTGKKYWQLGPFVGHFAVLYMDGIHPTFLFQYENRNSGPPFDKSFNTMVTTWDYQNGSLTQRTDWISPKGVAGYSNFHQIRIADVDRDGKDEMVEGGYVIDDNGQPLFGIPEIIHGDRHQTTDIDPDHPGLETFIIQQNNPSSLGMALYEAATGKILKKWYQPAIGDVGRGESFDLDARHKGLEMFSTMGGMYNAKGEFIGEKNIFPSNGIWWDGDLQREMLTAPDGNGFNQVIQKPGLNPDGVSYGIGPRIYNIAQESNWLIQASYGARPMFFGDIQGDWREEVILKEHNPENTGNVAFRIYTTKTPASTRLYTLMHNPAYRQTVTCKGYYQAAYTDYYLGVGMATPPVPPIQEAKLTWKGGLSSNAWDVNNTSNWQHNDSSSTFSQDDDVMFDISGAANASVQISGIVNPKSILVNGPVNYTFGGPGTLSGSMSLLKSGSGTLTFNNSNNYTGLTTVDEGALVVNGNLLQSPVLINWKAKIGGTGTIGQNVTFKEGGIIVPGLEGTAGTITFGQSLTLPGEIVCKLDLSDDTTGIAKPHDKIVVNGDLTLTGSNTIHVNQINGNLPVGTYDLITYSGAFSGDISTLKIAGILGKKYIVNNSGGVISVTVLDTRDPAKIYWAGIAPTWDLLTSSNWLLNGETDFFAPNDSVVFDGKGSFADVTVASGTMPIGAMTVETSTTNYKFTGTGSITGAGGITKNGAGILSLLNKNGYTGKTIVNTGRLEVGYLDDIGLPSAIGATSSTDPSYLVLNDAVLRYSGNSNIYTNRGITLGGASDTIEIATPGKLLTLKGVIAGTGKLVKTGAGSVVVQQQNNTFTGGVLVKQGSFILGDDQANRYGLGPENSTITLEGGTLSMFSEGSYNNSYWNMIVPAGSTASFNADYRCELWGSLTGAGTLNMYIPYVRTDLKGNWSAFTGRINALFKSEGKGTTAGDFRIYNSFGYANATIHLGSKEITAYRQGGGTVAIGELSGVANSSLAGTNWTIGAKNTNSTFAGKIKGNALTKVGTGVFTLTDTSTYAGATIVNGGKLLVNYPGIIKGTGAVSVNNGATIGGTGILSGLTTIASGGTIAPGNNSIGALKINNSLTLASGSATEIEINKTANTKDQIISTSAIKLNGTLRIIKTDVAPFAPGDSYALFSAANISGSFSAIDPAIPGEGIVWDTTALRSTGVISVKGHQNISFILPTEAKFGDAPFDLVATGGDSGNPVTFSIVSGDAIAISGNTVTIVKAGVVEIKAAQAGNSAYYPATDVIQTITIAAAEQTISFTVPSNKKFGDVPFNLVATGGASGNPVTFSIVSGDAITLADSTVTIVKSGIVEIKASQTGDDRYLPAVDVIQTLIIGQPPVASFTADPTSGYAPLLVSFDASATSDADNDSLTYSWDFGDGATTSGIVATHTYVGPGNYTAILTVEDSRGDVSFDSAAISTASGLKAQYRARVNEINPVDNHIKPHFQIVNTSDKAIPYSELKLRYWFTSEGNVNQVFWCDYALLGTSKVKGSIVPLASPAATADHYLEVSFTSTGSVAANGNSGEIQTRFNKTNWSNYNEVGDYSYDPTKTNYQDWNKVTLYRNGILFWGTEPVSTNLRVDESSFEVNGFSALVSPNPARSETSLRIYSPKKDKFQIRLMDMTGRTVIDTNTNVEAGESKTVPLSISSTNKEGLYILKIINSENKGLNRRS